MVKKKQAGKLLNHLLAIDPCLFRSLLISKNLFGRFFTMRETHNRFLDPESPNPGFQAPGKSASGFRAPGFQAPGFQAETLALKTDL